MVKYVAIHFLVIIAASVNLFFSGSVQYPSIHSINKRSRLCILHQDCFSELQGLMILCMVCTHQHVVKPNSSLCHNVLFMVIQMTAGKLTAFSSAASPINAHGIRIATNKIKKTF